MKIVLASQSRTRQDMLRRAGVAFTSVRPMVDETSLKQNVHTLKPDALAIYLADAKAVSVANQNPDTIVIGADQVLNLGGTVLDKPASLEAARKQLRKLSGQTHRLETAVCCVHKTVVIWRHHAAASLTMRSLTDEEINAYLQRVGDDALTSVGAYKLEGMGVQLFETVDGDFFTILGLPLLPLLAFLRAEGAVSL